MFCCCGAVSQETVPIGVELIQKWMSDFHFNESVQLFARNFRSGPPRPTLGLATKKLENGASQMLWNCTIIAVDDRQEKRERDIGRARNTSVPKLLT